MARGVATRAAERKKENYCEKCSRKRKELRRLKQTTKNLLMKALIVCENEGPEWEELKKIGLEFGKIVALIAFIFVLGCAATVPFRTVGPKLSLEKSYKIGEELTSTTGSAFLRISTVRLWEAYSPRYDWQPPKDLAHWDIVYPEFNRAQVWLVQGIRADGMINIACRDWGPGGFGKPFISRQGSLWSLDIHPDGTIPEKIKIYDAYGRRRPGVKWDLPDRRLFDKAPPVAKETGNRPEEFKAELIYNGVSKNTIKISYREFLRDMARPAFYQELNYDLDKSDLIQFKTFRIKVLNADNSTIRFVVLNDEELPWVPIRK